MTPAFASYHCTGAYACQRIQSQSNYLRNSLITPLPDRAQAGATSGLSALPNTESAGSHFVLPAKSHSLTHNRAATSWEPDKRKETNLDASAAAAWPVYAHAPYPPPRAWPSLPQAPCLHQLLPRLAADLAWEELCTAWLLLVTWQEVQVGQEQRRELRGQEQKQQHRQRKSHPPPQRWQPWVPAAAAVVVAAAATAFVAAVLVDVVVVVGGGAAAGNAAASAAVAGRLGESSPSPHPHLHPRLCPGGLHYAQQQGAGAEWEEREEHGESGTRSWRREETPALALLPVQERQCQSWKSGCRPRGQGTPRWLLAPAGCANFLPPSHPSPARHPPARQQASSRLQKHVTYMPSSPRARLAGGHTASKATFCEYSAHPGTSNQQT
eukprot:390299-Pelagomonas_calceolata.AAC.2